MLALKPSPSGATLAAQAPATESIRVGHFPTFARAPFWTERTARGLMTDQAAGGRSMPEVRFHLPAAPLRPLITSYYIVDAPGPLVDFTHPEWGNIRFSID